MYVVALPLEASMTEMKFPLDRVRAARQRLSFVWCSLLFAVSLLVVVHVFVAAFQRFRAAGRLRHLFQTPAAGDETTDINCSDTGPMQCPAPTTSAGRASVSTDRRVPHHYHHHHHRTPCGAHQSMLQSPASTSGTLSPSYQQQQSSHRLQFPLTTTQRRSLPLVRQTSPLNAEGAFYKLTDRVVESNV